MAIERNNWELVSDLLAIDRRDFPLADKTLLQPITNALYLIDGEWLKLQDGLELLERAVDTSSVDNIANRPAYPLWAERGRTDVRAMTGGRVPIWWMRAWEADTRVFDAAATAGANGVAITYHGQPLKVASIQPGGAGTRIYSGLAGHGGVGVDVNPIVGYVTKLPSINDGKLRVRNTLV